MYFIINLLGVLIFLAVGVLLSKKRKDIHWRGVGSLLDCSRSTCSSHGS